MAARILDQEPAATQLRYLQTVVQIGTEKNTSIVFLLPIDLVSSLARVLDKGGTTSQPTIVPAAA